VLRLERDLININQAVNTAARNVRQSALSRKLDLRVELADKLPPTIADGQRVQQILWNLLANAIKFTPAGGSVVVRTRLVEDGRGRNEDEPTDNREDETTASREQESTGRREDESAVNREDKSKDGGARWIEIEVEDTGEGIPADFMPHIWDRFRQADGSATRRHGGLGIGLSLVRELAEAHGGWVEAESTKGRGARFNVRLPDTATATVAGSSTTTSA